jgi:hypothetical protein
MLKSEGILHGDIEAIARIAEDNNGLPVPLDTIKEG